jgi:hypothetical protein
MLSSKTKTAKLQAMNKLIFCLILCVPISLISQETISISYGERLNLGRLAESYDFEIQHLDSIFYADKIELDRFVFDKPGIYSIKPKERIENKYFGKIIESSERPSLPGSFSVMVDSIKMEFLPNTIRMNHPFAIFHDMSYVLLTIDCEIKNYYGTPINFQGKKLKFKTAGIGANVEGEVFEIEKKDNSDIYSIIYQLKGKINDPGYIQLDFEKLNGEITPIGWNEEIR